MISEAAFTRQVIELAQALKWRVAHFRPAQTNKGWRTPVSGDGAGFPDLVLVHPKKARLIFAELKSEDGRTSKEQDKWLDAFNELADCVSVNVKPSLADYFISVNVWRPSYIDDIERELRR